MSSQSVLSYMGKCFAYCSMPVHFYFSNYKMLAFSCTIIFSAPIYIYSQFNGVQNSAYI